MCKLWPLFSLIFSSIAAPWNFKNDPFFNASKILETKFEKLPQSSELTGLFGSQSNWRLEEGGILNRWAQKDTSSPRNNYDFIPIEMLKNIDIGQLSPSEKFDLYLGNSNWNFSRMFKTKQENEPDFNLKSQLSFARSVLLFENNDPMVIEGKSGLKIPMGSSDLAAILYASLFLDESSPRSLIGEPCKIFFLKEIDFEKCSGINAGTFHLLLTNYLGLRNQGIIADLLRDNNLEIRPLIGYVSNFKTINGNPKPGIKKEILVNTFVKFVTPRAPTWTNNLLLSSRGYEKYTYILELDEEDNIIGGSWISFDRPDFIVLNSPHEFKGIFKSLNSIYVKKIKFDSKFKAFAQKEVILESLRTNQPVNILNLLLEEYFENYKIQLIEKKSLKKIARENLVREINLSKSQLLKKINSIQVSPIFKLVVQKFVSLAHRDENSILLRKIHYSFLDTSRRNFRNFQIPSLGKIAYLQQKYLDDFIGVKESSYDRIDFLQRYFLFENSIQTNDFLSSNKNFYFSSNLFLKGMKKQKEELSIKKTGLSKIIIPLPAKKNITPLVSSFIEDVKNQVKVSRNKYWKIFLSPERTISEDQISITSPLLEFKNYKQPRDYSSLKRIYRLSFAIKKIQARKKAIYILNDLKEKTSYYQSKFKTELTHKKIRSFFHPLSSAEGLSFCPTGCFNRYSAETEYKSLLISNQKEVNKFRMEGENLIKLITTEDLSKINTTLSNNNYSFYQSPTGLNPLLTAIQKGNKLIVNKLIEKEPKTSLNFEDKNGRNALFFALHTNQPDTMKALIEKGIDINARDNQGFFPRDLLKRNDPLDSYLENLGGKLSSN